MYIIQNTYKEYIAQQQKIARKCPYCKSEGCSGATRVFDNVVHKVYECPCMKNNFGEYIFWTPRKIMSEEEWKNKFAK